MNGGFFDGHTCDFRTGVYLAGKVAGEDWRSHVLPYFANTMTNLISSLTDSQWWSMGNVTGMDLFDHGRDRIMVDYCGPFFVGEHRTDQECSHGTLDSGLADNVLYGNAGQRTRRGLRSADLVVAFIDSTQPLDCHGTLFELGYAAASGIAIQLIVRGRKAPPELWFIHQILSADKSGYSRWLVDDYSDLRPCFCEIVWGHVLAKRRRLTLGPTTHKIPL